MIIGTSYFVSKSKAIRYYRAYEGNLLALGRILFF